MHYLFASLPLYTGFFFGDVLLFFFTVVVFFDELLVDLVVTFFASAFNGAFVEIDSLTKPEGFDLVESGEGSIGFDADTSFDVFESTSTG